MKKPHGEGCCHGVRTEWLKETGGHDERYIGWGYEDKDLALRAKSAGFKMVWIDNQTSMIHLPHPRNKNYFSNKHISANKNLFESKRLKVPSIKVNIGKKWGSL